MSDLVERLREHWHGTHDQEESPCEICREAADEIERLRDGLRKCGEAYGRDVMSMAQERNAAHDRITHLERVVEAADELRGLLRFEQGTLGELVARAYDAVRKGEG